jgi:hypothetical protein
LQEEAMTGSYERERRPDPGRRNERRVAKLVPLAVAAVAAGCLAAGGAAPAAAAARPDAGGWRVTLNLTGKHNPQFTAITAAGPRAAWAFEGFDPAPGVRPAAWQLTAGGWHRAAFPGKARELVVSAGSSSATNVWAFTSVSFGRGGSRALRWNGSSWQVAGTFRRPVSAGTVIGPSDVWVFGLDLFGHKSLGARHWNGHRWTAPPSGHGLQAGSGLSANDVWAVTGKTVAHWNGHRWKRTSVASLLPKTTLLGHPGLTNIWEQSPASVWALGTAGRQDEGGAVIVLHFDGHTWTRVAKSGSGHPVQIVPDGSGGFWIPSPSQNGEPGQILHYTGGKLLRAHLPISGARLSVQAIAHVPGTTRSFGAGQLHRRNVFGIGLHAVLLQVS